jgi:MFS family permease
VASAAKGKALVTPACLPAGRLRDLSIRFDQQALVSPQHHLSKSARHIKFTVPGQQDFSYARAFSFHPSWPAQHSLWLGHGCGHLFNHAGHGRCCWRTGLFIVPLEKQFGWDAAEISSALAIRFALFGMMGPFAAAFMNRFGVRQVVMASLLIVLTGLLLSLAMTRLWQLVVLWGIVIGLGTGLTAIVLGATVATRWFHARRGLVVGLLEFFPNRITHSQNF